VDNTKKLNHIGLCHGYGGIELGLAQVLGDSLRTIAVCEVEAFAIENTLAKMEQGMLHPCPIWNDLRTFPWREFHGKVDILTGGFPCQSFSAAGKRLADADPRHLFPYILNGIEICRPSVVFLENVEGIISARLSGEGWNDPAGTPVLLHVCRELERVGYSVSWGIFSASEFGLPHQRKRVFILAISNCDSGRRWKNRLPSELWAGWTVESPIYSGLSNSPETAKVTRTPARPGQPQHEWEPKRVC